MSTLEEFGLYKNDSLLCIERKLNKAGSSQGTSTRIAIFGASPAPAPGTAATLEDLNLRSCHRRGHRNQGGRTKGQNRVKGFWEADQETEKTDVISSLSQTATVLVRNPHQRQLPLHLPR